MKILFTLLFTCLITASSLAQNIGELNTNFGTEGSFLFDPSVSHDKMEKLLVQKDGKIITVGGARLDGSNYSIYVSRHNTDGTLDVTYGENGIANFKANPLIYMNYAFDAALNEDDYLFITGYTFDYVNNTGFILCLDENGIENTEYGENGFVISDYGGGIVYDAIKIDSKGRAVIAGYYDDQILVRRYNAKGKPDVTFGNEGSVTIILDPTQWAYCYAYDLEILDDGKIIVTGHKVTADMIYTAYLLRLKSNGNLDETFADNGVLYLDAGKEPNFPEYAVSVSVQPDGKYIVGGHDDLPSGNSNLIRSEAFITRVNTDGTIDESFGTNGIIRFEPFEGEGCTNTTAAVMATEDGQIFGTLYSYNANSIASRAYVYNLDNNGNLKEDFVGSGIMALPKIDDEEVNITTKSLALKDNKNLLVGGYVATDHTSSLKIFISDVNVDIKGENPEPENPGEGIEELTSSLLLYPNPVKDKIYIETPTQTLTVEIYDVYGRPQDNKTTRQQGCTAIDMTDLNSGVYFVKVVSNEGETVKRVLKL